MSGKPTEAETSTDSASQAAATLPPEVSARFNGELENETIVAWSPFDLDENNRYAQRFAVLTENNLLIVHEDGAPPRSIRIADIQEATITEGLGVDRLNIVAHGKRISDLRYTHHNRRSMTRLHRKLERRLPSKTADLPPDWLDTAERKEEQSEHCPKCGQIIPAYAEGVCPQCQQTRKILWRLLEVAKPYRKEVWWAVILTVFASSTSILPAWLQRYAVDWAIFPVDKTLTIPQRIRWLLFWCAIMLVAILVNEFLSAVRLRILAMVGTKLTADLRHMVYAHMHELSLRYFAKRRTGSLITRVTNDTDRLWDFIVFGSIDLIRDVALIAFTAALMFLYNWKLAIIALTPLPPLAILTYQRGMKLQAMFGRLWTYWSRMTAVVGDALPGVRVVKAFANEQREIARFDRRSNDYTDHEWDIHKIWTTMSRIISALMQVGRLLVLLVGGYLVIKHPSNTNSIGTLLMFLSLIWQFYTPIMELANSNRMVTRAATSATRIFEVLDTPPEIYSTTEAVSKEKLQGRVEFRQVSFSYEGAQPALREVSLEVQPGEMIGLCGSSGAGKSTFVNLICRFYDVTDGQILIDGIDIRDYDVKWLRRQVGMVLQEPYLFHGTIADNIRYGNSEAAESQVIIAAKAANAHDFIVSFPDGYDTMVGERGQSLSGGERQRISIARAILHNPRILILDEATSSVDTETEKQIQQALDRLVEGRTTFAIAHRLSTLQAADRLIVLEKGKVVEQGLHADLLKKDNGIYAKLHNTQAEMNNYVTAR